MQAKPHRIGRTDARLWQIGFCVLLAVLFLYNPFIALYCSHAAYSVHTPQRNRATVGASELQQFGPVQDEFQKTDLTVEENREDVAVPAGSFVARGFEREEALPQPDYTPKVWSRPPPEL